MGIEAQKNCVQLLTGVGLRRGSQVCEFSARLGADYGAMVRYGTRAAPEGHRSFEWVLRPV